MELFERPHHQHREGWSAARGALYFVGCVIRTVIVGAHGAPYDSVAKAGQQRMAGRTDFVGCVIRTVIAGAHGAPYDFIGKAGRD